MIDSVFIDLTIELTAGFVGLLVSIKIIGKRQMNQVSPFDFISAVLLGELVGNGIYDNETKYYHILYGIFIWTLLVYIIEIVTQKSKKIRRFIEGTPALAIKNGMFDYNILKKEKLDIDEFLSMLRDKDAFSIREIEYAIIEANGNITVIKKSPYANVTINDLNIVKSDTVLNLPLITDGDIDFDNLAIVGYDEAWLRYNLKQNNINNIEQVLYAEWNSNDGIYIQKKD